jgi:hypothetical protein
MASAMMASRRSPTSESSNSSAFTKKLRNCSSAGRPHNPTGLRATAYAYGILNYVEVATTTPLLYVSPRFQASRSVASLLTINKIDANSIGEGDEVRVKRDICEQILGSSRWGKIRCGDAIAEKHQSEGPIVLS